MTSTATGTAYEIKDAYQSAKSAGWYEAQYGKSLRAKIANWGERRAFRKLLSQVPAGGSVLDVACGTGRFLEELLDHGFNVTGTDVSPDMLAIAQRRLGSQSGLVGVHEGDAEALPFEPQSFDGVTCMRLYHRVPPESRARMLREVRRVGRGWAILFFGISSPWLDARRALRARFAERPNERYPITQQALLAELEAAGLTLRSREWAIPVVAEGLLTLVTW